MCLAMRDVGNQTRPYKEALRRILQLSSIWNLPYLPHVSIKHSPLGTNLSKAHKEKKLCKIISLLVLGVALETILLILDVFQFG